jgi:hypothetical protein
MAASLVGFGLSVAAIFLLPSVLELFTLINATIYVSMAILALSLALIWGYGGILCFGQAAFFGLGGYTYAVAAINFGDSTWAVVLAMVVPALFARAARLLHVLGPDRRRVPGRDHAHDDADLLQAVQRDGGRRLQDRQGRRWAASTGSPRRRR